MIESLPLPLNTIAVGSGLFFHNDSGKMDDPQPQSHLKERHGGAVAELDLTEVDIGEVQERLTLRANWLFLGLAGLVCEGLISGLGVGPDDLAMGTLLKFLNPQDTTVAWSTRHGRPTTQSLGAFLRKVMENDLRDLLEAKAHTTTVIVDPLPGTEEERTTAPRRMSLDDFASESESQDTLAIRGQRHARLLAKFEDVPDLRDVLAAQLDPEGYQAHTNQQLATLLDTSLSDVENRKKRVKTRLVRILNLDSSWVA